jgi:enoyl-CoA hydratase/carnithine racemase
MAKRLHDAPQNSVAAAKHAVYMSDSADLERMLQYETEAQLACFESGEARERVRAFLEKRQPR